MCRAAPVTAASLSLGASSRVSVSALIVQNSPIRLDSRAAPRLRQLMLRLVPSMNNRLDPHICPAIVRGARRISGG